MIEIYCRAHHPEREKGDRHLLCEAPGTDRRLVWPFRQKVPVPFFPRGSGSVCGECAALRDYAFCRLDRCPFGADKTTCARCPIHCYKPAIKDRVKEVMRYAGPRMIYRHPILALLHQLDDVVVSIRGKILGRKTS